MPDAGRRIETPRRPKIASGDLERGARIRLWSGMLAPYRTPAILLFVCQIGQTGAALLLPSMSADIIDKGVLANDRAFIVSHGLAMLAVAAAQIMLAIAVAWLGARIAIDFGRSLRASVFARVQDFALTELRGFGGADADHPHHQ